jgi:hypothetical protein
MFILFLLWGLVTVLHPVAGLVIALLVCLIYSICHWIAGLADRPQAPKIVYIERFYYVAAPTRRVVAPARPDLHPDVLEHKLFGVFRNLN